MRVCIVTVAGHGIGGMQDHTRGLARGLTDAGHEVEVITSGHPEGLAEAWRDGVRWRFVEAPGRHTDPAWLRRSYEEFERASSERPFDVAHSESSGGLELVRRGVHHRVPFVVMFHGNFLGNVKASVGRALASRRLLPMLREARHVVWNCEKHFPNGNWYRFRACEAIVPSREQLADTCRSLLLKRSRVHVVPNGVDAELFRPRPQAEARADLGLGPGPLFVCVGRLDRRKGVHHAIRALALLGDGDRGARLAVVGQGEELDRLRALARGLGLERRVVFAGTQPAAVVAAYLCAADAFLFPTELNEAQGLVVLQAMACGVPVIASRVGGIPEVVDRPGDNGLLIPRGDVRGLAEAIRRLLQDRALRRRLGEAARRRVLAEYTIERMTERTIEVYRIAAARLGKRARPQNPAGSRPEGLR